MATSLLLDHSGQPFALPEAAPASASTLSYSPEQRDKLITLLTAPFRIEEISWRVISTTKDKKKGLIAPFVRTGYILERLNTVVGFGRWNKVPSEIRVDVTTKEGAKRTKIAMTCKLEVPGIGTNSSTGECWGDEDNSVTSCEAQAFKRAAQNLGIGAYLFRVPKFWADLDQNRSIVDSPGFKEAAARTLDPFLPEDQRKKKQNNATQNATQQQNPTQTQKQATAQNTPAQKQQIPAQQSQTAGNGKAGSSQHQTTQTERTQTPPSTSISADQVVEKMNAKKAASIEALGQALYDDVVANAKRSLNPVMSATNKAYVIAQTLDATIELLNETRALAGELPPETVDQVMDTYHVTTFSVVPTFAALERVSLALKTIATEVVPVA